MSNAEKIYCIIVTYNAQNWINKCLNSVLNSTVACTIVVIDNQSSDRTSEIIQSQYPQVKFIQNTENAGFGKANNMGIRLAYDEGADYFFLLNQDAWVEPSTMGILAEKIKQHPEYGILSPLQYYNAENLDRKFKSYLKGMREEAINRLTQQERDTIIPVRFVNAALWMMSRKCIETVGLFAPIFDHYGEDQNYAHRCKFHHLKLGVYLDAVGYHEREQYHSHSKHIPLKKLLNRDKHFCLSILLNLKHSYTRQWLFFIFTNLREFFKYLLLLQYKKIAVILHRINFLGRISELKQQRKIMESKAAFMDLY